MSNIAIVECPRDAMQGWKEWIPTGKKIEYLNALLRVGFDTIDFGSFVSPKAIPQMADTKAVLKELDLKTSRSKLLAIVANERGAEEAVSHNQISFLGFPFSISETFQLRNTNSTPAESLKRVEVIQQLCASAGKRLVVYLSMGFGNPYGDPYNESILLLWAKELADRKIKILSLADTVGLATPKQITDAITTLVPRFPAVEFGVHLHSSPVDRHEKLKAAVDAGITRIDGALKGIGGCPMAGNELVGNMDTEFILDYLKEISCAPDFDQAALETASSIANTIFH